MTDDELIPPRSTNRRRDLRRRVFKGAVVLMGDGQVVFDCTIRNLSDRGAKIEVEQPTDIPDEFELALPSMHRVAPAKAAWRKGREIGVELTGQWRLYGAKD